MARSRTGRALSGPGSRLPVLGLLVVLGFCVLPAAAQSPTGARSSENDLKSAFLYRFVPYVDWPPSSTVAVENRLTFCVLGDDPLAASLETTVRGKSELGRPLAVRRLRSPHEAPGCAVLFIGLDGSPDLAAVLSVVHEKPILTVGEDDDFTKLGGIVRFYPEANKLRFEINPDAAEAAGLKLGSRLLSLARIARGRPAGAP